MARRCFKGSLAFSAGMNEATVDSQVEVDAPGMVIAVVIVPDSMYTPLTYQSSALGPLTMRRRPTCQSSELVDVGAAMLLATLTRGAEPVDAHRPTVPAEN